jgi:ADP-ribose pyrophosphatase YjhB (NUDIX family)
MAHASDAPWRTLLEIADAVRAIATTGLHFTEGPFDRERYRKLLLLAAQLGAVGERRPSEELMQIYVAADEGYVTPKLDVRMAVFDGGSVLLVKERADECWALPGGYVDVGDSPSDAAVRETHEEANIDVRAERLAGIFDYRLQPLAPPTRFHIHKLVFVGVPLEHGAEPRPGHEVHDARYFPLDALPPLSEGRTLPVHIHTAHRMWLDGSIPTHFD